MTIPLESPLDVCSALDRRAEQWFSEKGVSAIEHSKIAAGIGDQSTLFCGFAGVRLFRFKRRLYCMSSTNQTISQ